MSETLRQIHSCSMCVIFIQKFSRKVYAVYAIVIIDPYWFFSVEEIFICTLYMYQFRRRRYGYNAMREVSITQKFHNLGIQNRTAISIDFHTSTLYFNNFWSQKKIPNQRFLRCCFKKNLSTVRFFAYLISDERNWFPKSVDKFRPIKSTERRY